MRRTGVQCPPAVLMRGGVIRLTANADCLFDWTPLPQHHEWLQGRMTPAEWSALLLSLNEAAILSASKQYRGMRSDWHRKFRLAGAVSELRRVRNAWLERGLDITPSSGADTLMLYFKCVPLGSSPVNNAEGIGRGGMDAREQQQHTSGSGPADAEGTWASAPPAYATANAPPVATAVAAASSAYAFPIVVKPAPSHSSDEGHSPGSFHLILSAFRFCPLCAAPVEAHSTGKSFCGECGGKWRAKPGKHRAREPEHARIVQASIGIDRSVKMLP